MLRLLQKLVLKRKLLLLVALLFAVLYLFSFSLLSKDLDFPSNNMLEDMKKDIVKRQVEDLKKGNMNKVISKVVVPKNTSRNIPLAVESPKKSEGGIIMNKLQPIVPVLEKISDFMQRNTYGKTQNPRKWGLPNKPIDWMAVEVKRVSNLSLAVDPDYNIHLFYYMWYGSPEFDEGYLHWNHQKLPHWNAKQSKQWPQDKHIPPDDVASSFYPALGPYSSRNPETIALHMKQIRITGAGVISVSWYPPGMADENGKEWDQYMTLLMNVAATFDIKVCFHIEPYKGRTPSTLKTWIQYIVDKYGDHPAFLRYAWKGVELPVYYIYDSYHIPPEDWAELLSPKGSHSIRGTPYDGIVIGLLVDLKHLKSIHEGGFNGFYTYFASNRFTYGSSPGHWDHLSKFAYEHDLLFIPSVGPGYMDTEVRPWNSVNTRQREDGEYYIKMFREAIKLQPYVISITSFNEWHEGTQIEEAIPHTRSENLKYLNYSPHTSTYYLNLTRTLVNDYQQTVGERHCC